jgi:hypothetical protein
MVWGCGSTLDEVGILSKGVRFEVGIGSKVHLWHDVWCPDQPLKHVFPSLLYCKVQRSLGEG